MKQGYWIEVAVVAPLVMLLACSWMSDFSDRKDGDRESQVKSKLHTIQLAVERFAVDTSGVYPEYLIGGEGKHSNFLEAGPISFLNVRDCPNRAFLSDPLLREGYLKGYPKNPFVTYGAPIYRIQMDIDDPMRCDSEVGLNYGTRFGAQCDLMGSVLADFRFQRFMVIDPTYEVKCIQPSYANIPYPCWDVWKAPTPSFFLPGMFFYKSWGDPPIPLPGSHISMTHRDYPLEPLTIETYALGAYGGLSTRGMDVLGPEPVIIAGDPPQEVPAWTRSGMALSEDGSLVSLGGSPFGPAKPGDRYMVSTPNPNGIADAIILLLTPKKADDASR